MKAYKAYDKASYYPYSTVVFAETPSKAKSIALWSECFEGSDLEYTDIRVTRIKMLDSAYRGLPELDWEDPGDRRKYVEAGWSCDEDSFDPDWECKDCSGKDICHTYQDYLKDIEEDEDTGNTQE